MVKELHAEHDITDKNVIAAMGSVPRHLFVSEEQAQHAYNFGNLPIGEGQVIGDPYLVAFMTQSLKIRPTDTVLEVGTGCGYQAAVLSKLVKQVYSIEIREPLANSARERLKKLGYKNVQVKAGDGYLGWPEHAPFDAIIVTAFPDTVPQRLLQQLKPGGHMVTPVGGKVQRMKLITRGPQSFNSEDLNLTGLVLAGQHHKQR